MTDTKHTDSRDADPTAADPSRPRVEDEDDVEGHNIGAVNPILAGELARAREQDVARSVSRSSVIGEFRRAARRKR